MERQKSLRFSFIGTFVIILALLFTNFNHFVQAQTPVPTYQNYLPVILYELMRTPTPTPIPPSPIPGENIQCKTYDGAEICASVSDRTPAQYTTVTVYGRLTINGSAQVGKTMYTTWHYKTTTPTCNTGITNSGGVASCSRSISSATAGYLVNIGVTIGG